MGLRFVELNTLPKKLVLKTDILVFFYGSSFCSRCKDPNIKPYPSPLRWLYNQRKYILFEDIDNFNRGLRFVDLVVYFYKTKTVLGLRFVDSRSLSLIAFSVMQEMLADNRFSKISREKSTLS